MYKEGNPFTPPNFEKSGSDLDGSKETKKSTKKKKSPEAPAVKQEVDTKETEQRESFADRFKAALADKAIETKAQGVDAVDKEKPEAKSAVPAEKVETESAETAETDVENSTDAAEITPEEDPEVNERLIEGNIEELEAEIAATDDELTIVENKAAIKELKNLPDRELVVEAEAPESEDEAGVEEEAEAVPEHQAMSFGGEEELRPFNDKDDIVLTTPPAPAGPQPPLPPAPPSPSFEGPNFAPPAAANIAPAEPAEYQPDYRENPNRAYLLIGAVVGYLYGRRKGRIKTERRMNKVVGKLEKQVDAKQQIIDQHIEQAKQKARQEYWDKKGRKVETATAAERSTTRPERSFEAAPARPVAERRPESRAEAQVETRSESRERRAEQVPANVELRSEDIVRISETIKVGATNLKNIFEARLVSPNGLRRIVMEHLQGKDIRRGLAREFLAKELSFERDPRFRDVLPQEVVDARSGGGAAAVANSVDLTTPLQQPITSASQHADAPVTKIPVKKQRRPAVSTGVLAILTVVALALAAYAVILGLTH